MLAIKLWLNFSNVSQNICINSIIVRILQKNDIIIANDCYVIDIATLNNMEAQEHMYS